MTEKPKILVVEDDGSTRSAVLRVLRRSQQWDVSEAEDAVVGLTRARELRPDLIISDYRMPGVDGIEFCQQVRTDPGIADTLFVMLTAHTETILKVKGLRLGVDDFIAKPVEIPELLAKVQAMLRIKSLHDELRRDKLALETVQHRLSRRFDHLLSILLSVLDRQIPGAKERGERLAAWSLHIAERLAVPSQSLCDLRQAAMLHEIGKLVERPAEPDQPAAPEGRPPSHGYVLASKAILQQVDTLEEVGELVGSIYENWNGSGFPDQRHHGQIPLPGRILRTLIDFFSALESGHESSDVRVQQAVQQLQARSGTWYDPVVLQHLDDVLRSPKESPVLDLIRDVPVADCSPA